MFTKKKSSTGFAEKNKEHMQKTEESIKKTADNLKSSMESKMKDSEFQAWKSEMLKDLNEIGKKMDAISDLDADRDTDAIMNAAKKARAEKDAGMKVVNGDDEFPELEPAENTKKSNPAKSINDIFDGLYAKSDKEKADMKKTFDFFTNPANNKHDAEFAKGLSDIDDIIVENTKLMSSWAYDMPEAAESINVYRDAELKMMAEGILTSIESGKTDTGWLHSRNFFKTDVFASLRLASVSLSSNHNVASHIDTYAVNVLLRSIDKLPYVNEVVAKYMKEDKNIELFDGLVNVSVNSLPDAVVSLLYEQTKSFQKLVDSLHNIMSGVRCNLTVFKHAVGDRLRKTMTFSEGKIDVSLDALSDIPTGDMTETMAVVNDMNLSGVIKSLATLTSSLHDLCLASKSMRDMTTGDIALKLGISSDDAETPEGTNAIRQELGRVMEIVNVIVKLNKNVSAEALKCIYSVARAEDAVIYKAISNDDKLIAITMSQLAHYMAHDPKLMPRVWKIINK